MVVSEVMKIPAHRLYTTRINSAELLYGAYNSSKPRQNLEIIKPFLERFTVLELTAEASEAFAMIKADLKRSGTIIADMDLMIAAIALVHKLPLVTNNLRHFGRIKGLEVRSWL